jgi:hypothetical protein
MRWHIRMIFEPNVPGTVGRAEHVFHSRGLMERNEAKPLIINDKA